MSILRAKGCKFVLLEMQDDMPVLFFIWQVGHFMID